MKLTQKSAIKSSADAIGLTGAERHEYENNPTKWIDKNLDVALLGETRCLLDGTTDKINKQVDNTVILIGIIMATLGLTFYLINPSIKLSDSYGIGLAIGSFLFLGVGSFFRLLARISS